MKYVFVGRSAGKRWADKQKDFEVQEFKPGINGVFPIGYKIKGEWMFFDFYLDEDETVKYDNRKDAIKHLKQMREKNIKVLGD